MKDYPVTLHTLDQLFDQLTAELKNSPFLLVSAQEAGTGKWGMSRLWRAWMTTTATYMARNGCTMPLMVSAAGISFRSRKFNSDDAHELFTAKWLGHDENGKRFSWSKKSNNDMTAAKKGQRFHALRLHEDWCSEKGITLFNPVDSEYRQLQEEQEAA